MAAIKRKARIMPDKPFNIVLAGRRFRFSPGENGWIVVRCLDRRGVNTQGRTLDEACFMALDALREMEEFEQELWPKKAPPQAIRLLRQTRMGALA